tara:strand:- start:3743 stop:3967 length:225 start_codon:yes stop_codon:yes gene_type:complete
MGFFDFLMGRPGPARLVVMIRKTMKESAEARRRSGREKDPGKSRGAYKEHRRLERRLSRLNALRRQYKREGKMD